jgi:hypothetical protein
MSIVFAAIAAVSFTIDQTVGLSMAAGGGLGELSAPARLLNGLIDISYNPFGRAE